MNRRLTQASLPATSVRRCRACEEDPAAPGKRGYCSPCYWRWYRAGRPDTGPPPARHNSKKEAAARRADVKWLVESGESIEQAAARVGVTVRTAQQYLQPETSRECAVSSCDEQAEYDRWCTGHRDIRSLYGTLRARGFSRRQAAAWIGIHNGTTYRWEPGQPGIGRPRKERAA